MNIKTGPTGENSQYWRKQRVNRLGIRAANSKIHALGVWYCCNLTRNNIRTESVGLLENIDGDVKALAVM